jgi:serine/threonine protein phosphatase 1
LAWNILSSRIQKARPRIPDGTRIYAVGDIHGRADLLGALFARIDADLRASPISQPIQVFVSDYIDRGPNSREVLDQLVARRRAHTMLCLKGNHETFADQFLDNPSVLSDWKHLGGVDTLLSYGVAPSATDELRGQADAAEAFRRAA